jgi:hypothetical protein
MIILGGGLFNGRFNGGEGGFDWAFLMAGWCRNCTIFRRIGPASDAHRH